MGTIEPLLNMPLFYSFLTLCVRAVGMGLAIVIPLELMIFGVMKIFRMLKM